MRIFTFEQETSQVSSAEKNEKILKNELQQYHRASYLSKVIKCKLNDTLATGVVVAAFQHFYKLFKSLECFLEPMQNVCKFIGVFTKLTSTY